MSRPRKARWARLSGEFWRSPKVRRLSLAARGLLATAWSYASDQATDGRVPIELLQAWAKKDFAALMRELTTPIVIEGKTHEPFLALVKESDEAQAHDWLKHNIAAADWEAKLEKDRDRKGGTSGAVSDRKPSRNGHGKRSDSSEVSEPIPKPVRGRALDEDEDDEEDDLSSRRASSDQVARPPALTPDPLALEPGALGREVLALQRAVNSELKARRGIVSSDLTSGAWTTIALACRELVTSERDLDAIHAQLARGFAATEGRTATAGWPVSYLAKNVGQYLNATAGPSGVARSGYVRPADSSEHTETSDDDFSRALGGGGLTQ